MLPYLPVSIHADRFGFICPGFDILDLWLHSNIIKVDRI